MKIEPTRGLPLKASLQPILTLGLLVMALMASLSVIGLALADRLYPTEEFIQSFMTNDLVNLLLGVPVLAAALWLAGRGKPNGLFLLPGSMLYVVYNSLAYVFGRPFDLYSGGHLALILICVFAAYFTFSRMDHAAIQAELGDKIPVKLSGWVLAGFGLLFFFRAVAVFAGSETVAVPEVGVLVADMVLSVLLVAGGVMLLRRKAVGVAAGLGLLYAASMLFVGLIVLMAVQAVLNHTALLVVDMLVVLVMGTVCFVPFARYLKSCG
ncbi:MAG: hypothetical protein ACK2T7_00950 [Anaerolineales bacterium]